ncbi:MAG: polyprenyl synthetase family protein [Desulfobulbaceae bacterium]|nr:polyprenyl synthetase family protein [Desulfobulbaceae bacterium]HIJ78642.1 polyprenyl synthetase family protein [Deltaproteobacteria bacterium]
MNSSELLAALKQQAEMINATMREDLTTIESPLLADIINHAIFQGGKRVRPLLTMMAATLIGPPPADTPRLAISFEYLHAASLLHDDVIDHADLRRGKETANKIWGISPVILAGDFLHARAMSLAGAVGGRAGMEIIGQATAAMVEAEFLQMQIAEEIIPDDANYFRVLMGKTAALISAACEAGVVHAGGNAEQRRALRVYGTNLGLAFQIVDDLLDYLGDPARTGKAVGNDFQEGKMTLPLINTLARADEKDRDLLLALLKGSAAERQKQVASAHGLINKYQGFAVARQKAQDLMDEALSGLKIFSDGPAKDTLIGLAHYVLNRDK